MKKDRREIDDEFIRASYAMVGAAGEMRRAAAGLTLALEGHQRFMDDWLRRFAEILQNPKGRAQ